MQRADQAVDWVARLAANHLAHGIGDCLLQSVAVLSEIESLLTGEHAAQVVCSRDHFLTVFVHGHK